VEGGGRKGEGGGIAWALLAASVRSVAGAESRKCRQSYNERQNAPPTLQYQPTAQNKQNPQRAHFLSGLKLLHSLPTKRVATRNMMAGVSRSVADE
jgi:hypothetical protein